MSADRAEKAPESGAAEPVPVPEGEQPNLPGVVQIIEAPPPRTYVPEGAKLLLPTPAGARLYRVEKSSDNRTILIALTPRELRDFQRRLHDFQAEQAAALREKQVADQATAERARVEAGAAAAVARAARPWWRKALDVAQGRTS